MSDIHGIGYGSSHNWKNKGTSQKTTLYSCECGEVFTHRYDEVPDIFEAIKKYGVAGSCPINKN